MLNFDVFPIDAEFIDGLLPADIEPTAVLMNPPFSSTSGRVKSTNPIYGARHVASALRRLKEGGRLVAIVSEAMSFHHPSFSEWWQRIACLCNIRANLTLDGKQYAKYGAAPHVQILAIDKTGTTPGANWPEQLKQISWGSAATLEEVCETLKHLVEQTPTEQERYRTKQVLAEGSDPFVLTPPLDWFPPRPRIGEPRETQLALDFKRGK